MTILSLFLDKAGLVFSALALLVSILSYRNSREIKIKTIVIPYIDLKLKPWKKQESLKLHSRIYMTK